MIGTMKPPQYVRGLDLTNKTGTPVVVQAVF